MTKELVQKRGQGCVAIGQPSAALQLIKLGDKVAWDRRMKRGKSLGARLGAPITLVLRLISKVTIARHGEADKRAIPTPAINKGEQRRPLILK